MIIYYYKEDVFGDPKVLRSPYKSELTIIFLILLDITVRLKQFIP